MFPALLFVIAPTSGQGAAAKLRYRTATRKRPDLRRLHSSTQGLQENVRANYALAVLDGYSLRRDARE